MRERAILSDNPAIDRMAAEFLRKHRHGVDTTEAYDELRDILAVVVRDALWLSLSTEALARLDAIAAERGQTRSGAVEQLVRNARSRETESR